MRCRTGRLVALVFLVPAPAWPQQLPVTVYTVADGLGSNFVSRIDRDSRGFLWFSTRDGLSRFDGARFTTYDRDDGLPESAVNDLLETRVGVYWVATNGAGACRFELATTNGPPSSLFTCFRPGESLSARVNVLHEDATGRLWAGTDDGLFRARRSAAGELAFDEIRLADSGAVISVNDFLDAGNGAVLAATTGGLFLIGPDGAVDRVRLGAEPPTEPGVFDLLRERTGLIWATHHGGVVRFGLRHGIVDEEPLPPGAPLQPNALLESSDGRVWIGGFNGLSVFDGRRFRSYSPAQGLVRDLIGHLAEDSEGNLWMAARGTGVVKLTRAGFTTYTARDGLAHPAVASVHQNRAGDLFFVGEPFILNRLNASGVSSIRLPLPPQARPSWLSSVAYLDSRGGWWTLSTLGLHRLQRTGRFEDLAHVRPERVLTDPVMNVFEDARGDLWVAGWWSTGTSLVRWERASGRLHRYTTADGLPVEGIPLRFAQDRSGRVLIGFHERGGIVRHENGRFVPLAADTLADVSLITLFVDRAGRVWAGSSDQGLFRIDDPEGQHPRVVAYGTAQGLSSSNVRCIVDDAQGRIYVGTARGLDRLDPATGSIRHYTTADGLAPGFLITAFRDRQDVLWLGTLNGLSRLVPEPDRVRPSPPVFIDAVRVDGRPVPFSPLGVRAVPRLELPPGRHNLEIAFFGIGFGLGEALRYRLKFEGADAAWSPLTPERTAFYPNLGPGTYRVLVEAVSADGIRSTSPASVELVVFPPIWQRWWFLLGVALVALASAVMLHRVRVARLLEVERVRTRIATDLHDDLGARLSRISILAEAASRHLGGDAAAARRLMADAGETARGLLDAASDIAWSIDPQRDNLSSLVARVRRSASEMLDAQSIVWSFEAPATDGEWKLSPEARRHLLLIFQESLHNIVRHARAEHVSLVLCRDGRRLRVEIHDDGVGFVASASAGADDRGQGLRNIRTRARQLGGELTIESAPGRGTTIGLVMPL
jgi:ligand-binding sensor domain-containing protein/signal transduction histidine kinase